MHELNITLRHMFASPPNWSLIIAIIAGLAALTALGFWFQHRKGLVKVTNGDEGSLTVGEVGGPLGAAATLVMFSTRFCSICPSARAFFEALVGEVPGVSFYEVDAEKDLVLAKKFGVKSTPTTLVLNASGNVMARIIGAPKRANTLAIIKKVAGVEPVSGIAPISSVKPVSATKGANE